MSEKQTGIDFTRGGGAMRMAVYNSSGVEVGEIIGGCMYAVPAGMPGGGPGTLVCSELIARQLVARRPQELSLSAGCYKDADVERMQRLPHGQLQQFCAELMHGVTRKVEEYEIAQGETLAAPGKPGSAAAR